ncbi:MAG: hypothetical protein ACXVH1_37415 [Solirubrobacteraceae bacterium]
MLRPAGAGARGREARPLDPEPVGVGAEVLPSLVQKGSRDERRPTGIHLLRDGQVVMAVTLSGALKLAARHQQLVRVLAESFE